MTNGVLDRVDFTRANLSGAKFVNAVVSCLRHPRDVLQRSVDAKSFQFCCCR